MAPSLARIVLALALATAACTGGDGRERLGITTIEVTGETDLGALEVEVHLFDALTGGHLGCAGQGDGLEDVDHSDVRYQVFGCFRDPVYGNEVAPSAVVGRAVDVHVIEDDSMPCLDRPGPDDDVIGIATGLDLAAGQTVGFDDVTALRIAIE